MRFFNDESLFVNDKALFYQLCWLIKVPVISYKVI